MIEILKKGNELDGSIMPYYLQSGQVGLPPLVDWYDHASSGDRKVCGKSVQELRARLA